MEKIRFQVNIKKALEAILYVSSKCQNLGYHSICKLFFYADIYHLNTYGRPVFGDEYEAWQYGPVPKTTYNLLKQDPLLFEALSEGQPFEVIKEGSKPIVIPHRDPEMEYFSKSDIEALDYAIEKYAKLSFGELTAISHKHPAWINAGSFERMDYEDFIDPSNSELIYDLKENSQYMSI